MARGEDDYRHYFGSYNCDYYCPTYTGGYKSEKPTKKKRLWNCVRSLVTWIPRKLVKIKRAIFHF